MTNGTKTDEVINLHSFKITCDKSAVSLLENRIYALYKSDE